MESLVVAFELLVAACGLELPDRRLNPRPLHWDLRVLATEPPGKSFNFYILKSILRSEESGREKVFLV